MAYDVLKLAKKLDRSDAGATWYEVKPAKVYPATVKRILEVMKEGILPKELLDYSPSRDPMVSPGAGAMMYVRDARQINPEAWGWALKPREEFTKAEEIGSRALALELARRWFTRALHMTMEGEPIGIRITEDEKYRL